MGTPGERKAYPDPDDVNKRAEVQEIEGIY
jgi:hypothetical protein